MPLLVRELRTDPPLSVTAGLARALGLIGDDGAASFFGGGDLPMSLGGDDGGTFVFVGVAHYQRGDNQARQAADDLGSDIDFTGLLEDLPRDIDLMESEDDAPVIKLINAVLSQAINERASDIHIESLENDLSIRLRVDGVLRELIAPDRALGPLLVSRLKVMARLDIAEKRIPQDGRISIKLAGRAIDIRVSTIPSAHGERVVLRLLDKESGQLRLDQLGIGDSLFVAQAVETVLGHDRLRQPVTIAGLEPEILRERISMARYEFDMLVRGGNQYRLR